MTEPIWLQKNAVLAFHEIMLAEHGGLMGMRNEGLLDSALGRPLNQYFYESATLYDLAAAYAFGIVQNHPFVDGNKRTAFVSMKTFLLRNHVVLNLPKVESVQMFFDLAAGKISEPALAKWIKKYSKPAPDSR